MSGELTNQAKRNVVNKLQGLYLRLGLPMYLIPEGRGPAAQEKLPPAARAADLWTALSEEERKERERVVREGLAGEGLTAEELDYAVGLATTGIVKAEAAEKIEGITKLEDALKDTAKAAMRQAAGKLAQARPGDDLWRALEEALAAALHAAGHYKTLEEARSKVKIRAMAEDGGPGAFDPALPKADPELSRLFNRATKEVLVKFGLYPANIAELERKLEEREAEIKRLKTRRPPEKTIISQRFIDGLLDTQETALARIERSPALREDDARREKLQGIIESGDVGFNLDVDEMRVVQGIFNLLTDRHDPDNPQEPINDLIRLNSWSEFYRACGAREYMGKDGRPEMDQWDRQRLYRATVRLRDDKKFWMLAEKVTGFDKKTKSPIKDAVEFRDHLFTMAIYYRDLKTGELREIEKNLGKDDETKCDGYRYEILMRPAPLMVDQYSEYWRTLDSGLYHELSRALGPGHKVSRYDMRFIYLLHRGEEGRITIQTNMEALARQLGMIEYLKPRKRWDKIEKTLLRLYKMAKAAGYITDYQHKVPKKRGGTKEIIYLNPAKILHARQRTLPGIPKPKHGETPKLLGSGGGA